MKYEFTKELNCLAEIEHLIENTSLLSNKWIRDHFNLLLELRDELENIETQDPLIIENILDDISLITKEITVMISLKLKKDIPRLNSKTKRLN